MSHDRLVCQAPCERQLRCGHRCEQVCGQNCYCQCPGFTGAYPNDEFGILDSSDQESYSVVGRSRARVPTRPPRATRAGHRGGRMTFRGGRGGFGNHHGGDLHRNPNLSINAGSNALSTRQGNWNAYNARRDDASALRQRA